MSDRICSFADCTKPARTKGLCGAHYRQQRLGLELVPLRVYPSPIDRFWAKVDRSGGPDACWPWIGAVSRFGYGNLSVDQRSVRAHRFAYEAFIGPIPVGMMVDHMCHNQSVTCGGGVTCPHRACVNPAHLALATPSQNSVRSALTEAGKHARKTHCIHGHEFTPENTYTRGQHGRVCATCHAMRSKRIRESRAGRK